MKPLTAYWINEEVVCKDCLSGEERLNLDHFKLVQQKDVWIWCHRCNQLAGSDKVEEINKGKAERS